MFYWATIYLLRVLFPLFTRFKVKGQERIPRQGSFLLVSNHISHFDPPVFSAACPRAIDWAGSEILFRSAIARFYFARSNVIKVRQYEADAGALRESIRRVRKGRCVGLFPEGGIRCGEKSVLGSRVHLYEGASIIAMMSGSPILPCLVMGSDRLYNPRSLLRRPSIWVRFGNPIPVQGEGKEERERLKQEMIRSIRELAEEWKHEEHPAPEDWPQTPQQRNPKIPPVRRVAVDQI